MNIAVVRAIKACAEGLKIHNEGLRQLYNAIGTAKTHFEKGREAINSIEWS